MQRRPLFLAGFALLLAAAATSAWSQADVAGIKYPGTVTLGNSALQLNGAGVRYRFVVKVYTAGLYLQGKAATPEAVLAMPGPKRMHVVMLRDIDATELGKLFTKGMQDNMPREDFVKIIPGTIKMADVFSSKKRMVPGENFSVDYVPGVGTTVLVNGKASGDVVQEPEFFNALLRIWLGPSPADAQLKDALLGMEPKVRPGRQ
jgi:hypothetical protein